MDHLSAQKIIQPTQSNARTAVKTITGTSLIIGYYFCVWFFNWLGSVLIPYLRIVCQLSVFSILLCGLFILHFYTVMAIPSSLVLKKTGFKKGMSAGLLMMALWGFVLYSRCIQPECTLYSCSACLFKGGLTILQTASNPYITIPGHRRAQQGASALWAFAMASPVR